MPERGGTMLGMSRTSVAGRVKEHEFVLLQTAGSALEYRVLAGNQPEVVPRDHAVGKRNHLRESRARFSQADRLPERVSGDSVEAWIDGGPNDKGGKIGYPYHRVDCG